ncbi:MAG: class I lanthipeptide [Salinivirgaceae bacterium]|nr:class I lanthipeptide [Salinivirgaceae bacterium]
MFRIIKKLSLNKETVAHLNKLELKNIHGGKPPTTYDCLSETQPRPQNPAPNTRGVDYTCMWEACM